MSKELLLTLPIPPSVNHYLAYRAIIKNGRPMAMSYKTKEALQYQKDLMLYVEREVANQQWDLVPNKMQHFYIDAVFYFGKTNQDANNYFKVMLDAITDTQLIWLDDNVTCERVQGIYYDSENPHVDIRIHPTDYIGVFKNASQLAEFESNCIGCKRYKRNCSLLKNAKEGRIQQEIRSLTCSKFASSTAGATEDVEQNKNISFNDVLYGCQENITEQEE